MGKSADAFRTISEVADWLGVQAHVLRFWESKFTQIKPVKRAGGRRYYRPTDMRLIGGIKHLLHDDGLTIKGVQKLLRDEGVAHVAAFSKDLDDLGDDVETSTGAPVVEKQARVTPPAEDIIEDAPFIEAEEEAPETEVVQFAPASQPQENAAPEPEPVSEPEVEAAPVIQEPAAPAAAPATPKIVSPDIPPLDESEPDPGLLTHAFACAALSRQDAKAIQPWMDRLQSLRDQMAAQLR